MSMQRDIQLFMQSLAANITERLLEHETVQYYKLLLTFLNSVLSPSSSLNVQPACSNEKLLAPAKLQRVISKKNITFLNRALKTKISVVLDVHR